jgi:hypothetical protein
MIDLEGYNLQFETEFDNSVAEVVAKVQNITQGKKAAMFGVSRRTIIDFEKADGSCRNYKLLYFYRLHVYGDWEV